MQRWANRPLDYLRFARYSFLWFYKRAGCLGSLNSSSSIGAPFSTMNATRTPLDGLLGGIRISRPASSEARSVTSNATCGTCRTRIRDGRVFETHPLHAKFAFLVTDDKDFQVFQVDLAGLRFGSGNFRCDGSGALCLLSVGFGEILLKVCGRRDSQPRPGLSGWASRLGYNSQKDVGHPRRCYWPSIFPQTDSFQ
jgi:hypothetical protein